MEREDFLKHYMEIQRPLRAYLLAATGDLHEADDLSQAVWQVLWKKLDQYDDSRPFKAWSFGIARYEVLKWRQRKARSREVLSEAAMTKLAETSTDQTEELSAQRGFLLECVAELAALPQRAVRLKYGDGWRSSEIGEIIDRSTEAVDMMLSRARKALRECVERKMMEVK